MEGDIFEIIIPEIDYYLIERVRELRIRHKPYLSMLQLAQQLGLPDSSISKAENMRDRFRYNTRTLNRLAVFFSIKSYSELFPKTIIKNDLVKMRLQKVASKKGKQSVNPDGTVDKAYKVISIIPLTEEETILWQANKLSYLTIIK